MKIIVYTSIYSEKDKPRDDIKVLSGYDKFTNPVLNSKIYKILPHKFFDFDISVWLDGNIFLKIPPEKLVEDFLLDADMAVFEHNHHLNIYEEAGWVKRIFKNRTPWVRDDVDRQMEHYKEIGVPELKASMCGMIIRRNTPLVRQFDEAWWAEICRWSQRDQLSFPVILQQFPDLKVNFIKGNIKNHKYLTYETHAHFNT